MSRRKENNFHKTKFFHSNTDVKILKYVFEADILKNK